MKKVLQPRLVLGALIALSALAGAAAAEQPGTDPAAVFRRYCEAINRADVAGLRALISAAAERPEFPCDTSVSNKDCLLKWLTERVINVHGSITQTSSVGVDGNTVYGGVEVRTDLVTRAGDQRLVGIDRIKTRAGRIIGIKFLHNEDDPQTRHYYDTILGADRRSNPPRRPRTP